MTSFFCLSLMLPATQGLAQTVRETSDQSHLWLIMNGNTKINDRFSVFHDVQFRRDDFGMRWQQLLLRAGLTYKINVALAATAGYGFVDTYPYGDFPVANTFSEHRIWEQLQFNQSVGKLSIVNRYRLEQRMIGNASTGEFQPFRFENRMRYMGRFVFPVAVKEARKLSVVMFDEIFINFGKNVGRNTFDQNRLFAGLNYSLSPKVAIEVGYLNQMVQLRTLSAQNLQRFENNHTLMITKTLNY